ncbi:retrotransposon protein, putative, ty1-copia subclass [Tanacetum coccineum]
MFGLTTYYAPSSVNATSSVNEILGLIHADLYDFKATPSREGNNYYITFIDDYSKFCYVYLANTKDEALNMFKTYKAEVENQLDKKIKLLWSDRGGEYESNDFAKFYSTFGIVHQTTTPYTPQQNRVVEQKNSAAYRFLVYKSNVEDITNTEFFKNTFPYKDKDKQILNPKKRVLDDELSQDQKDNTCEVPQENAKPKRSKRAKVNKDFGPDYMTYIVNEEP